MKPGFHFSVLEPKSSQSIGCTHIHQTSQKNFKQMSARKLTAAVFWDRKGVLIVEFMQHGATIMSQVYCETLTKLLRAIQNKRHGMPSGVVLLHDNAHLHTAARTQALLEHFKWEFFDQPHYSHDIRVPTTCLPT
jgi:hypothetical protein